MEGSEQMTCSAGGSSTALLKNTFYTKESCTFVLFNTDDLLSYSTNTIFLLYCTKKTKELYITHQFVAHYGDCRVEAVDFHR